MTWSYWITDWQVLIHLSKVWSVNVWHSKRLGHIQLTWYWGGWSALSALLTLMPLSTLLILSSWDCCDTAEYCLATGLLMASLTSLIYLFQDIRWLVVPVHFIWKVRYFVNIGKEKRNHWTRLDYLANCLLWHGLVSKHSWHDMTCLLLFLWGEPIQYQALTKRKLSVRARALSVTVMIFHWLLTHVLAMCSDYLCHCGGRIEIYLTSEREGRC